MMKFVILALACVVAVCSAAELYAAVDVSEPQFNLARDGSAELNGDSPVRQAQRERRGERAAAPEIAGVSLMETDATKYRGPNGPALNRLTGAAKTFHPNDQMCVMCQFLVQRTQLDMAHFNVLGGFLGVKAAGAGGKDNAAAAGAGAGAKAADEESSFLEIASAFGADTAAADWEAEDAEDAAAMELAAKQELAEADGNWDLVAALEKKSHVVDQVADEMAAEDAQVTGESDEDEDEDESDDEEEVEEEGEAFEEEAPVTALSETSSEVIASGLTASERADMAEVMAEVRDDRVAASVDKQLTEGMDETPVMVETHTNAKAHGSDESEDESEAEADDELAHSLDAELDLSADEKADLMQSLHGEDQSEGDWTTPSYNRDGQAASFEDEAQVVEAQTDSDEDMALLQVSDESDSESDGENESEESEDAEADAAAEEELEGMADNVQLIERAANPTAPRAYARTLHVAEEAPEAVQPVMAELSGAHASFQSAGGLARVAARATSASGAQCAAQVVSRVKRCERIDGTNRRRCRVTTKKRLPAGCGGGRNGGGRGVVGISNSPRRFRLADALHSRPRWNRWDPTVKPHPDPARAKAREMWHHLMQMTYDRLEGYCSTRLPEQFTPFCRPLLRRFRVVAEGIRYGDRPNQICMRTRFCPRGSYVRRSPHNVFKHMRVGN